MRWPLETILALRSGTSNIGVETIRAALDRWHASRWHVYLTMGDFVEIAADAGFADEIAAIVDDIILERVGQSGALGIGRSSQGQGAAPAVTKRAGS